MTASENLLIKIELVRKKMTKVALEKGYSDSESVAISQELDRLLNLYDSLKGKDDLE
ncbi:aspartyl-phosphate phosphatase Spo0E family protein [Oceanobacillus senegalensis]|uniref:aspartyl-phosphate phosphatase Spo0E family protein n=1 Tax=Oceanobacillus senegalensis TaxID=1936063 RepID=UPI000A30E961|nr:aspartyl-phosphate phosphatase Spo0E family protein [Oceanobacillus senegalensis]